MTTNVFQGHAGLPGIEATDYSYEAEILTKRESASYQATGGQIDSAATDAGNTPTTTLRAGLLLGRITSSGKYTTWTPTATDGSQFIAGILMNSISLLNGAGTAVVKFSGPILISGHIKAASIIVPGQSSASLTSQTLEHLIRTQMSTRFVFDDKIHSDVKLNDVVTIKTADYTVLEADNGTLFTNRGAGGAVVFTLPATAKKGLRYRFYVVADQSVTVTCGTADTGVAFNDAAVDSVAFSTASKKVGASLEVIGDGTSWLFIPSGWSDGTITQTVTLAT